MTAYHVVWECVVEQWLGVRRMLSNKILFYNKFIIRLYMFRALCAHHQEVKNVLYSIWYHHTL